MFALRVMSAAMDVQIMAKSTIRDSAQVVRRPIPSDSRTQTTVSTLANKAFSNRPCSKSLSSFAVLAQLLAKVALLPNLTVLAAINKAI